MYEDTVWWAERNNPEDYADHIEFLLDPKNKDEIEVKNAYAMDRILHQNQGDKAELYANSQDRAAVHFEKIFMEGMK